MAPDSVVQAVPAPLVLGSHQSPISASTSAMNTRVGADIKDLLPPIRDPRLNPDNYYLPYYNPKSGYPAPILNQWIEYYYKYHPLVGNAIDIHSQLPISRFGLVGIDEDSEIRMVYEQMVEDLNLLDNLYNFLKIWWLFGEVQPYWWWSDDYNRFVDMTFIDTSYVRVVGHYLTFSKDAESTVRYELILDNQLTNLVQSNDPYDREVVNYLDDEIVFAARNNLSVELDPFSTELVANRAMPWDLRGTSIVNGVLKDLLQADQLRLAQNAIAQGMITPKWIWKLGSPGPDGYMPTDGDLQALRDMLLAANNDPTFALITHHAVTAEVIGNTGKILPIGPEMTAIDKRIMTRLFTNEALTHGSGPNFACNDELRTQTLTENGFKYLNEIEDGEKIATFNPDTECLEYHVPISKHVYDYDSARDGKMVRFQTGKIDIMVTPNHRMYSKKRDGDTWEIIRADEVRPRAKFRSQVKWEGVHQDVPQEVKDLISPRVTLSDWCKISGYFASEGWTINDKPKRAYRVGISQTKTSKHYDEMKELFESYFFKSYDHDFVIYGEDIADYFDESFGKGQLNRFIPKWMKNLPVEYLQILLDTLVDGDGNRRPNTKKKPTTNKYYSYCSISMQLADDVYEIALKLGYVPKVVLLERPLPNHNDQYHVYWSDSDCGKYPVLMTKKKGIEKPISRVDYKGRVYCFEVPNHLFITRRNGIVTIQGNTASVALRALMSRYLPIRSMIESVIQRKVFLPVALANNFFLRKKADLAHGVRTAYLDEKPIIPDFDWRHKQSLLDDNTIRSNLMQMRDRGDLPLKILSEGMGLNYEELLFWLEEEQGTIADRALVDGRKQYIIKAFQQAKDGVVGVMKTVLQTLLPRKREQVEDEDTGENVPEGVDTGEDVEVIQPEQPKAPSTSSPTQPNQPKQPKNPEQPGKPLGGETGETVVDKAPGTASFRQSKQLQLASRPGRRFRAVRKHWGLKEDDLEPTNTWQERLQLSALSTEAQDTVIGAENAVVNNYDAAKDTFISLLLQRWKDKGSLAMADIDNAVREGTDQVNDESQGIIGESLKSLYVESQEEVVEKLKQSKSGRKFVLGKRAQIGDDRERTMEESLNNAFQRITTVPDDVVEAMRQILHDRPDDIPQDIVRTLFSEIDVSQLAGITEEQLEAKLGELWDEQRYIYQRIVRTETMNMYSRGSLQEWSDAGYAEATRREMNDHKTCAFCRTVDGNVYSIQELLNLDYPLIQDPQTLDYTGHPNCRGSYEPIVVFEDWDNFLAPPGSIFKDTVEINVGDTVVSGIPVEMTERIERTLQDNDLNRAVNVVPDIVDTAAWLDTERARILAEIDAKGDRQPSDMFVDLMVQEQRDEQRGTLSIFDAPDGELLVSGFSFFADDPGWFATRDKGRQVYNALDAENQLFLDNLYNLKIGETIMTLEDDGLEIIGSPVAGKAVGFITPAASQDAMNYFVESYSLYQTDAVKLEFLDINMYQFLRDRIFAGEQFLERSEV